MMFKRIVFHVKSGAKLKAFKGKFLVWRRRPISMLRIGATFGNASVEWTCSFANSCAMTVECAGSSLLTDSTTPTLLLLLTG
ncbi:hypothetical protein PVL29_016978 [Vitis rotundifolia]|uniref:Uncharacterized protein n=1 Tax=Vitis rotundifolia TaxID=103349 RepID=A0AA38Z9L3_VITRO|nr:hypothetical protein PVL29_016978 [Vitis rotundifolia]